MLRKAVNRVAMACLLAATALAGQMLPGDTNGTVHKGAGPLGNFDTNSDGTSVEITGAGWNPLPGEWHWDPVHQTYESSDGEFASLYFDYYDIVITLDPLTVEHHWRKWMHNYPFADRLIEEGQFHW